MKLLKFFYIEFTLIEKLWPSLHLCIKDVHYSLNGEIYIKIDSVARPVLAGQEEKARKSCQTHWEKSKSFFQVIRKYFALNYMT